MGFVVPFRLHKDFPKGAQNGQESNIAEMWLFQPLTHIIKVISVFEASKLDQHWSKKLRQNGPSQKTATLRS